MRFGYFIAMNSQLEVRRFIGQDPADDPDLLARDRAQLFPFFQLNFERWLPASRSAVILDFGCGYGTFLSYLKNAGYTNLRGVDPDARCAKAANLNSGVAVACANNTLDFLATHPSTFDLISALSVVGYFEREQMLNSFRRLYLSLKPGGRLLLEVNNSSGLTGSIDYIQDPYFKSQFTDITLSSVLTITGFEIEFMEGLQFPRRGWRRFFWLNSQSIWHRILRLIYILERGAIERNPRIFNARILAVARRPAGDRD
jgi:SAM-dependent methyltransferase